MKTIAYPEIAGHDEVRFDADPYLGLEDTLDPAEWEAAFPDRDPTDDELDAMAASFFGGDIPTTYAA